MNPRILRSNLLLLLTAVIWGFAFVAQRVGAEYVGSFTFNGVRFGLGSLSLLPLLLFFSKKSTGSTYSVRNTLPVGIVAGFVLYGGASLQQLGMHDTTAGKAAFITGLYIVLVPILGIFLKHYIHIGTWVGVAISITGLYLLCVTEKFTIMRGDLFELAGALFWTIHILLINHFTKKVDVLKLSCIQFTTCSILSLSTAFIFEKITVASLQSVAIPILYGGICSVGIAYTLQAIGQKHSQPTHAAIIMSMETVFASLGGFILLNENMGVREYTGCAFMLAGMLVSQLQSFKKEKPHQPVSS